jgi:anti-anti-sigma factor
MVMTRFDRQLQVSVQADQHAFRLVLVGELDLASAAKLDRVLGAIASNESRRLVVDLRDVDFIDSTGLRLLLSLRNDAKRTGRKLALRAPGGEAARIFRITGTRGLFEWSD